MQENDLQIDWNSLPTPLPADASVPTPANQPNVTDLGQPFEPVDFSTLPEPLPAERGTLADMGVAAAHGIESAGRETLKTLGDMALHTVVPPFLRDKVKELAPSLDGTLTPKPETTIGKIESDLVRFGLGFLAGGTVIKGAGVAANLGKSALGTGTVADPHAERLSNLIESNPVLQNPVSDYLSAKENDSVAEGKFKAALEDVLTNSVAQLAFKTFKVAKGAMTGKTTDADSASMAEHILKAGQSTKAETVIDPVVKAEQARQAITPEWSPLKLSDEKAVQFKEKLDDLFKTRSLELAPANDGSVSVAHMDASPDILNTVSELSKLIEPEMKAAGFTAHQTVQATRELADQLGMNQDSLIGGLKAAGATADQMAPMILAGRSMIQGLASNVGKASQKALITGEGKDLAIAEIKRFTEVLSSFKSLQTGVARGLQTFGVKTGPMNVDELGKALAGKDGDDLLKVFAMAEGDPTAISKLAHAANATVWDKSLATHNEIWINALLSGPKTHIVNMASTSLNMLTQPLNLVAGGTLRREWSDVREGLALYAGYKRHFWDALQMARKSFITDGPILSPATTNELKNPAVSAINYNLDPESTIGQGVDYLGKLLRLPTRFLGAEDEFFKQLSYRSKVAAQATREAADLMKAGKVKESDLPSYIDQRMADAFNGEGAALSETGLNFAERSTFTQSLKIDTWLGNRSFGESLQSLAQTHPILRGTVLPFVRVPANLMRQVVDYTPVIGQVKKQFWSDIQAGGQRKTEAIGRLSVGSLMWSGAALLASEGTITGAAPVDKEVREALLATGWQPYSIKVGSRLDGSEEKYVSYSRLDPFGSVLGLVADYVQLNAHLPENKRDELASIMTLSLVNNLASKSYLKGLIDTLSIVGSSDPGKIQRWINQRASSYIPNLVASVNPDREMHEVRSVMDALYSKIPGYSNTLPAKRDLFGEKKVMPGNLPWSAFNPFMHSVDKNDPVRSELARLAMGDSQAQFSSPPETIGNVDLTTFKSASGQDAYDRYLELIGTVKDGSGRDMHKALADKISSHSYRTGTDGDSWYKAGSRVNQLRSVMDVFKDRALKQVEREYPELREALREDKRNRLAMKHGRERQNPAEALLELNR